jgi:hypothetical protein
MNGNLCGESTGEALSRRCAAVVGNNVLSDFATAPQWASAGMPDWVDKTEDTDQDADSIGCGMAFLSWMISQGYGLEKIAPALVNLGDSGTLAQLYAVLTSDSSSNAWTNFQKAIAGLPNGVTSDDPFNGLAQPLAMAHLSPRTAELIGRVFASLAADVAAGEQPERIIANLRAAMLPLGRPALAAVSPPHSKRLLPPKVSRAGKTA